MRATYRIATLRVLCVGLFLAISSLASPPQAAAGTWAVGEEGAQTSPRSAAGAKVDLVVWTDTRRGQSDIYGTRLAVNGTVLDPGGIPLVVDPGNQTVVSVGWTGSWFLLFYQDGTTYKAVRVGENGSRLDTTPTVVTGFAPWELLSSQLPFGGGVFLVTTSSHADSNGVYRDTYVHRLSPTGAALDAGPIDLQHAANFQSKGVAAWDGTEFMVAWGDNSQESSGDTSNIRAARVKPDGTDLDPGGFSVSSASGGQWEPSIAWNGSSFLVTWEDRRNGLPDELGAALVGIDASVSPKDGFILSATAPWPNLLTWTGDGYVGFWSDSSTPAVHMGSIHINALTTAVDVTTSLGARGGAWTVLPLAIGPLLVWTTEPPYGSQDASADVRGEVLNDSGAPLPSPKQYVISSALAYPEAVRLYAPLLVFFRDEEYWPDSPDNFIANSALDWNHDAGCKATVAAQRGTPT